MKIRIGSPKKKIQVKDLLDDLEKVEDVKGKVMRQINRGTRMSPMDFSSRSWSSSPSISASVTISGSASPSIAPSTVPWRRWTSG